MQSSWPILSTSLPGAATIPWTQLPTGGGDVYQPSFSSGGVAYGGWNPRQQANPYLQMIEQLQAQTAAPLPPNHRYGDDFLPPELANEQVQLPDGTYMRRGDIVFKQDAQGNYTIGGDPGSGNNLDVGMRNRATQSLYDLASSMQGQMGLTPNLALFPTQLGILQGETPTLDALGSDYNRRLTALRAYGGPLGSFRNPVYR